MDFVQVLNTVLEFVRVIDVLDFRPPPQEHTFRSLEPLYKTSIEHYQKRCESKFEEITSPKSAEDGETPDMRAQNFEELQDLLDKHCRLIKNLESMLHYPHLKSRKHNDNAYDKPEDADVNFGPQRFIEKPCRGYGFSNDYLRQWLAAIPGPVGRHFETEEASSSNLTRIFQQIILAIAAGASLLVPMIIMTFLTTRNARLIIVSVATVLFGVCFAVVSTSRENILAGTAAYAAVMVVYIGSASPAVS